MLLSIALFLLSPLTHAAPEPVLSSYKWENPSAEELIQVSRLFEITRRNGNEFELLVPASQAGLVPLLAPSATLVEYDTAAALRRELASFRGLNSARGYHDWAGVLAWIQSVASDYPQLADAVNYGTTQGGRPLMALRLTNKSAPEPKPALLLTAATHGDELVTTEVLIALVKQILAGYGSDPRFTAMLDRRDIYFVPVVNPDGYSQVARYETGRDPNRSYPYPENERVQPTPGIKGIIDLFHEKKFAGTIDFHAYGEMVMYPWAYTYDSIDAEDARRFHSLTGHMAEQNRYDFGPISKVIYVAKGSSADYYYWKNKSTAIAIEIGNSKIPRPEQLPDYVQSQAESTWRFIEAF